MLKPLKPIRPDALTGKKKLLKYLKKVWLYLNRHFDCQRWKHFTVKGKQKHHICCQTLSFSHFPSSFPLDGHSILSMLPEQGSPF